MKHLNKLDGILYTKVGTIMNNKVNKLPNGDFEVTPNEVYTDLERPPKDSLNTPSVKIWLNVNALKLNKSHTKYFMKIILDIIKQTTLNGEFNTTILVSNFELRESLERKLFDLNYTVCSELGSWELKISW